MKNTYKLWIIVLMLAATSLSVKGAISYSLDNRCATAQLVILVTPDVNYSGGQAVWNPGVFTISWPMSLGSSVLGAISNQNGFAFATAGALGNDGTYYYQKYAHTAATTLAMTSGTSYEVTRIALSGATTGDFSIPASSNAWVSSNNGFSVFSNSSGNQVPGTYSAYDITGIPLFAGIFWNGTSWCGGSGSSQQPGASDGALTCYVNAMGAQLTTSYVTPAVVNKLKIAAVSQLTIAPTAAMTVSDTMIINSAQGLVINADATGSGSFKNNPVPTKNLYNSGGSVQVNTYVKNTATIGSFQIHLIGPSVFDPAIAIPPSSGPGYVSLGSYNLQAGSTYSYRYRESTNSWINIYQVTDSVPRLGGIALSDVTGVSKTLSLSGRINTGTIADPTTPTKWDPTITAGQGNGCYVFSNPYTSYMDLDFFWSDNAARLGTNMDFYTWEHEWGNYGVWTYDDLSGEGAGTQNIGAADGKINPGQGFFAVLATTATQMRTVSTVASDNERVHAHTPFLKSDPANFLRIVASGNMTKDEIIVRFRDNATSGYDVKLDADKWMSMYEGATQIYTVTPDQAYLTINALPMLLPGQMTNVPMNFICGAEDTYTITASKIESFEAGTEIWLEDLQTGGEWYSLNNNPVYEFTAAPGDPEARFVLHFFGPTGIDDPIAAKNAIQIYGYQQNAYIVNHGTETVKEYKVYDIMGRELQGGTLVNKDVNVVPVNNVSAYYIVKVFTREGGVYTGKVFINK